MDYSIWKREVEKLNGAYDTIIKKYNSDHIEAQEKHDRNRNSNILQRTKEWWDNEIKEKHQDINRLFMKNVEDQHLGIDALSTEVNKEIRNIKRPLAKDNITASELQANRAYQFLSTQLSPEAITGALNRAIEDGNIDFYSAMYENLEMKLGHDPTSKVWQDVEKINSKFEQSSGLAELYDITSSLDEVKKVSKLLDEAIHGNYFPVYSQANINSMDEKDMVTNYDGMMKSLKLMGK